MNHSDALVVPEHHPNPPENNALEIRLARLEAITAHLHPKEPEPRPAHPSAIAAARLAYDRRREREALFGKDLFGEAAWDMMLDLFLAQTQGRRISISSLCIAAAVPPTTALRSIGLLTRRGIFLRVRDARDGRRVFVELSPAAFDQVEQLLKESQQPDF